MSYLYDPTDEYTECDYENDKNSKALNDIKYWLKDVLEQLYENPQLDTSLFERSLEELCAVVNMPIPKKPLSLVREEEAQPTEWKIFKEIYIKALSVNFEPI